VTLKDALLVRALAHHGLVMDLPADWWIDPTTGLTTATKVRAKESYSRKGYHYLEVEILEPQHALDLKMVIEISASKRGIYDYHLRRLLDMLYDVPGTLRDLGLANYRQPEVKRASTSAAAALAAWAECAPPQQDVPLPSAASRTISPSGPAVGPFADNEANEVWAGRVLVDHDMLAQTDVLEADPPNFQTAIKTPRL
jgi:hypothetical protein